MLTNPELLYSVPKWGPVSPRYVWNLSARAFILGLAMAERMRMQPSEWPTKLMRDGVEWFSTWLQISSTSRSVIVSKLENVSPLERKIEM